MRQSAGQNDSPLISIIIVTWNCRDYVLRCLETIYINNNIDFEIIVRDNGSTDGTRQVIQEKFPQVKLIGDTQNVGFAAANNEAIRQATGQYLLLLNPDTEIFPATLAEFIKTAARYGNQVMIVPTLLNSDGSLQPSRHSFPTLRGITRKILAKLKRFLSQHSSPTGLDVDWAIGACWFLPTSVFEVVEGLDTNLFMYGEDLDYCWRVHQAGFEIVWAPQIEVIHHSNISGQQKWGQQRLLKTYQGLIYFWLKYFNLPYTAVMIVTRVLYILSSAMIKGKHKRQLQEVMALMQACFDQSGWFLYRSARQRKQQVQKKYADSITI